MTIPDNELGRPRDRYSTIGGEHSHDWMGAHGANCRVWMNGEDVTERCVQADEHDGSVTLYVMDPMDKSRAWLVDNHFLKRQYIGEDVRIEPLS